MEPGPTPTFTPSTPASISACAPCLVATLPPMTSISVFALSCRTMSSTDCAWPCAVSTTRKSTPASMSAWARRLASSPTPTAAPTTSRPPSSLVALGNFSLLVKSFTVIRPRSLPSRVDERQLLDLVLLEQLRACSGCTPTGAVTSGMGVITSATRRDRSDSNLISRFVTIPRSLPSSLVTGTPEIR